MQVKGCKLHTLGGDTAPALIPLHICTHLYCLLYKLYQLLLAIEQRALSSLAVLAKHIKCLLPVRFSCNSPNQYRVQTSFYTVSCRAAVWLHFVVDTSVGYKIPHSQSVLQPSIEQPKCLIPQSAVQSIIQQPKSISHKQNNRVSLNTWNAASTDSSARHDQTWDCASGANNSAKHHPTSKMLPPQTTLPKQHQPMASHPASCAAG